MDRPFSEQMEEVLGSEVLSPDEHDAQLDGDSGHIPAGLEGWQLPAPSLRLRMREAASSLASACEPDGSVKLPREAALFLAALMDSLADEVPLGAEDYEVAFARGWIQ